MTDNPLFVLLCTKVAEFEPLWVCAFVDNEIDAVHAYGNHLLVHGPEHAQHMHFQRATPLFIDARQREISRRGGDPERASSLRPEERGGGFYLFSTEPPILDDNLFRTPTDAQIQQIITQTQETQPS